MLSIIRKFRRPMDLLGFFDRRSTSRVPYFSPAGYTNGEKFGVGRVENIASDGMLLITTEAFRVGETINIEFQFRHSRQKMSLQGVIARLARDGIGIKFLWH